MNSIRRFSERYTLSGAMRDITYRGFVSPIRLASIICGLLLKHGVAAVNPYSSAEGSQRFFADNPNALRVAAFFSFGSAVRWESMLQPSSAACVFSVFVPPAPTTPCSEALRPRSRLWFSAFSPWVLSVPEVATSLVSTRVLRFTTLLFGGVSFAVGKGLASRICFMQLPSRVRRLQS
jgi:hypothetical protein